VIDGALDIGKRNKSTRCGGGQGNFLFRIVDQAKGLVDVRVRVAIG
jgi:hypothetical protein